MGYKQGKSRKQAVLFPARIDDYIAEDNPVRFIDAFVEGLDLEALGIQRAEPASTGRPGYNPRDMLKLYIYGHLNQITSSRRLEKACHRNVEVMWLLKLLAPDFKTIADFRRDNRAAFNRVFYEFNLICRKAGLFGGQLVAIDGSKFKADNSKDRNKTVRLLEREIKEIDSKLERYLDRMDQADEEEDSEPSLSVEELEEKIRQLKEGRQQRQELQDEMSANGESQRSAVDPDSRRMKSGERSLVGYNVQIAVDAAHHLIVAQEVTNECNDLNSLSNMAIQAKDMLGVEELDVVADAGYCHGAEIEACEKEGITPYVPRPYTSSNRKKGLYAKEDFRYDREANGYWCPQGKLLTHRGKYLKKGRMYHWYQGTDCAICPARHRCTKGRDGRRIYRSEDEEALDRLGERNRRRPDILESRKGIVEHPFGTIKFWWNQGHFLTRGLAGVQAEFSLSALSYNIKRAIKELGVDGLIRAMRQSRLKKSETDTVLVKVQVKLASLIQNIRMKLEVGPMLYLAK